jgi:hypothetical protein
MKPPINWYGGTTSQPQYWKRRRQIVSIIEAAGPCAEAERIRESYGASSGVVSAWVALAHRKMKANVSMFA